MDKCIMDLDIAASGTVSVSAAADGVVTRSYYSESYGNVVFISHNMNGQTYTTVYAHLNSRSVSAGQSVKQGQQIGFMEIRSIRGTTFAF
ncbi:M23 family metallopeptidase [Bacillus cereus]|uniref:M23 family metallopeptidase n=1 Tax=Bacillus cereus TaxID=1396 RepID=UPI003BF787A6